MKAFVPSSERVLSITQLISLNSYCALQFLLPCLVRKRGSCLSPVVIFLFVIHLNKQIAILGRRKGEKRRENQFNPRESGGENDLSQSEKWLVFSILCKTQKGIKFIRSQSIPKSLFLFCLHICTVYIISNSHLKRSHWYNRVFHGLLWNDSAV